MSSKANDRKLHEDSFMDELLAHLSDPIHKQVIQAHSGVDPVKSMEAEIGKILLEVLNRED
jgi:hypothetical protein